MKKISLFLIGLCLLVILAGCGNRAGLVNTDTESGPPNGSGSSDTAGEPQSEPSAEGEDDMLKIEIQIGKESYSAALYDSAAARALMDMLPLTLDMSELNGNEKYFYLDVRLPTDAVKPSGIQTGDLMLYGDSCLVLFYKNFSTSYAYTPLGRIDDPAGLAAALGSGSAQVTFSRG